LRQDAERLIRDESELVRDAAAWAVAQLHS
jgi:hypothetical protein